MPALTVRREKWPIRGSFNISRGSKTEAEVVVVELSQDGLLGRGESVPYARYGETVEGVVECIESLGPEFDAGLNRDALQKLAEPGAARNAMDCALWDLQAKREGRRVWEVAGIEAPGIQATAYTLSLQAPDVMQRAAEEHASMPLLKLKLGDEEDLARVEAVRAGAPQSRIVVDANEAWTPESYRRIVPELHRLGVEMIEQPLPAGQDAALESLPRPVKVCADESCHDVASLEYLDGRYDMVNIKLDKSGGLTEALALRDAARARGLGIMVGCMLATSLAMAPALLVATGAVVVDLDGPLLLSEDREPGLNFEGAFIHPPEPALWG